MTVFKLFVESYEQDLFDAIGAESWLDVVECLIFCSFALFFITLALFLPFIILLGMAILPSLL